MFKYNNYVRVPLFDLLVTRQVVGGSVLDLILRSLEGSWDSFLGSLNKASMDI